MTKTKAAFFMAIILFVAFLLLPGNALAAEEFKLSASTASGEVGNQVKVFITADMAEGTEGGQFNLVFDHNLVKPVLIESGSLVTEAKSPLFMANLDYAPGILTFMWVTAYADTANNGQVCTVTFELLKQGVTEVKFEDIVIAAEGSRTLTAEAGRVSVKALGDGGSELVPSGETVEEAEEQTGPRLDGEEVITDENDSVQDEEDSGLVTAVNSNNGASGLLIFIIPVVLVVIGVAYYVKKRKTDKNLK
jgi:hypothetical protein